MARSAFLLLSLAILCQAGAESVVLLPGEPCTNAPVSCAPFADRMSAFVWRNWFCVSKERLAETVGATSENLTAMAVEMGLPETPQVSAEWDRYGYITVLRRNWHLLDYGQLMTLLGWNREKMRHHLLYDDYLFSKLGGFKPKCGALRWSAGKMDEGRRKRLKIAAILREEGINDFSENPRFGFIHDLSAVEDGSCRKVEQGRLLRISSGYFADCLDPLWDEDVGSFPEGVLARYAAAGVNGIWLHVVLNTLAKDPFFKEFGEGSERRQRNLRRLVDRAAKYGIKVFLYFNEPRPMPPSFFDKSDAYRACRGTTHWTGLLCAMCQQAPEVRRWLKSSIVEVFRAAPGLGGVFTITASEGLVHCHAHGDKANYVRGALREPTCRPELFCPRCEKSDFVSCASDLNALIAEAVKAADPSARVFVWDWGWTTSVSGGKTVAEVCRRLPVGNISFLTVSERGLTIDVDGTVSKVNEYTLSQVGPSADARAKWAEARKCGLGVAAKAQPSGSWEIASVPYIPVMDNVAAHAYNLMKEGVGDIVLSWTCGTYPAPNLKVFNGVRPSDAGPTDVLRRVADELYGSVAAAKALPVWTILSEGLSRYPFTSRVLYHGPHHMGPANPLYLRPTGQTATMTGIPFDDLDGWRRIFPRETYVARFDQMAQAFAKGADGWKAVVAAAEGPGRDLAKQELGIIRMIALNFASTVDQSRFVMARERGDRREMREIARRELARAKELLPIVMSDSRLGYESASQYFFIPQDLREKVVSCRLMFDD